MKTNVFISIHEIWARGITRILYVFKLFSGLHVVEKIRDPVVEKLSKYVIAPIISYLLALFRYNSNIEVLKTQLGKLRDIRDEVQGLVVAAERNGEVALPRVQRWLESAEETLEDRMNLLDKKLYLNLKVRYQRSRIATEKTSAVEELFQKSRSIDRVSIFPSRMLIFRDIMEALKDNQIHTIGIYGMAGVGKTTLVKEIGEEAKYANLFDEIAIVTVSPDPNLPRIQCEIADMLGLRFDDRFDDISSAGRARLLFQRLRGKRRLIILDDIEEKFDLKTIGIHFKARFDRCKTVLVSRSQGVCDQSGAEMDFSIEALSEDEGWKLFRRMVGDSVDSADRHPLAVEVAKSCAGLPLEIVRVARALKNTSNWSEVAKLSKEVKVIRPPMPSVDKAKSYDHSIGSSTYQNPGGGGLSTTCAHCEQIWASNNSVSNYQKLLRGEHIHDESSLPVLHPRNPSLQQHPSSLTVVSGGSLRPRKKKNQF